MLEKVVAASPDDAASRTFLALSRAATGACDAARSDLEQQFANNADASLRRLAGIALVQCDLARESAGGRLAGARQAAEELSRTMPTCFTRPPRST